MPSPHLTALAALKDHYDHMQALAECGQWDALVGEAARSASLIAAEKGAAANIVQNDRTEARALLQHILAADQRIRTLAGAWQRDATPLLATLNAP